MFKILFFTLPTDFYSFHTWLKAEQDQHVDCDESKEIIELLWIIADLLWIITAQGAVMNKKKSNQQYFDHIFK